MSLLLFQNARRQSEQKAAAPKKKEETEEVEEKPKEEGGEGAEAAKGDEGAGAGEATKPTTEEVAAAMVANNGITKGTQGAIISEHTPLFNKLVADGKSADDIAQALSKIQYAVAMKSASNGSYLVSVNATKEKAEEVYTQLKKYAESKSPDDAEEIFNISEAEIEGTEFETLGDNTYVKDTTHFVINPTNVLEVED